MKKSTIKQSIFTTENDLSKTQNTKEVIDNMVKALNDHRIGDIGEFFSNQFNWFGNYGCGTKKGLKEFQDNWQKPFQEAFSDKVCIDEARLFEGEWGAAFGRQEAVHTGNFMGVSPTNKKIKIRYMDFWQTKDNKIVNNWVMVDFPDVLKQLGVDIYNGHGWENFDINQKTNNCFTDENEIEKFIYEITEEIWENKQVENIRKYYGLDVIVRSPSITTYDCDKVVQATYKTLDQFPDRELIGEDVISCGKINGTYLSSHRILSTGTHLGDGFYGKATGKKIIYRVIADCLVVNNIIVEEWIIRDEASILIQLGFNVRNFVEQKINDGSFSKTDIEFTKNAFVQKYILNDCQNEYALKYKDYFTKLINKNTLSLKDYYDRAAQLYWIGGELIYTREKILEKWNTFLSCFEILKYEVSSSISLSQNRMKPRSALRWRLVCKHNSNGCFGIATNKEIEIYGIAHAEFGKYGIVREFILIDEISIWKQILI